MDVYLVSEFGAKSVPVEDLPVLLLDPTALVWVDIPRCDAHAALTLAETFGFHDIAIRDCPERNHISKLHVYDDHVFTVLPAPPYPLRIVIRDRVFADPPGGRPGRGPGQAVR